MNYFVYYIDKEDRYELKVNVIKYNASSVEEALYKFILDNDRMIASDIEDGISHTLKLFDKLQKNKYKDLNKTLELEYVMPFLVTDQNDKHLWEEVNYI